MSIPVTKSYKTLFSTYVQASFDEKSGGIDHHHFASEKSVGDKYRERSGQAEYPIVALTLFGNLVIQDYDGQIPLARIS